MTIGQRRKKLGEMARGNGLGDAYRATLRRLKAQKGNRPGLGLKALMWVLYSERPLRAEELRHALGVEIGSTEMNPETIPALRTLLSSCLGLVKFETSSSTVRLVHFTLKEHLSSDPTCFHSSHSAIAEVCLTYLNFGSVRGLSPTLDSAPSTMPLLEYASFYWGVHAKRGMTESVKLLVLRLLEIIDEHISLQLWGPNGNKGRGYRPDFDGRGGLTEFVEPREPSRLAMLGIIDAIATVFEAGEGGVNAGCLESPSITSEALRGEEAEAKILWGSEGLNPCQSDSQDGGTLLVWATMMGCEGVMKMLLEREDVNPNQALYVDRVMPCLMTPLFVAAVMGREGVVKMLLERKDLDPNKAVSGDGKTPLLYASVLDRDRIVKMLLEREDVNLNQAASENGWTALLGAAIYGRERIVKILLEREDINPDQADREFGRTPLSWAAGNGHEGVVKMLLEREDINPHQADTEHGRTPLVWAAGNGHEGVVKILLDRRDFNLGHTDTKYGRTPLSWAAGRGHEGVVKMLLEEDMNPDQADTEYGQTPLLWAAGGGHEGVVKILLDRRDVNLGHTDTKYGRTPLSWAAVNGREGVVKMLLEREDVNPDHADTEYGLTPLLWAAGGGHVGVVKILLDRRDVNPGHTDTKYGRTLLSCAAGNGYEGVVKMLLEREDVNPDHADTDGLTPLSWAAGGGHEGVVKILLDRRDVNPGHTDTKYGRTLSWAAGNGHEGVVKMLLEREDVNPDQADTEYGLTPLSWAAKNGHEGIVRMLLERNDVLPPTMPDNQNQDPLSLALSRGHDGVARILQQRDDVGSDKANNGGQASLTPSARPADESAVETQFRSPNPDTDATVFNDQPELLPATRDGPLRLLDLRDSISRSGDPGPSARLPLRPQLFCIRPRKLFNHLRKTKIRPDNPPFGLYWCAVIASLISHPALPLLILPFLLLNLFLFRRYSPALGGWWSLGLNVNRHWRENLYIFLYLLFIYISIFIHVFLRLEF